MKTASARIDNAKISLKSAVIICKAIKGKKIIKAKNLLQNLFDKKINLDGKYYTKTAKQLLELLETVEANAKRKNMDVEKLSIKIAKADKGERYIRPRTRWRFRGRRIKATNLKIMVG